MAHLTKTAQVRTPYTEMTKLRSPKHVCFRREVRVPAPVRVVPRSAHELAAAALCQALPVRRVRREGSQGERGERGRRRTPRARQASGQVARGLTALALTTPVDQTPRRDRLLAHALSHGVAPLVARHVERYVAGATTTTEAMQRLVAPNVFTSITANYWDGAPRNNASACDGGGEQCYAIEWASSTAPPMVAPFDFLAHGWGSCTAWATMITYIARALGVPARQVWRGIAPRVVAQAGGRGTREEAGRLPRIPPDERASPAPAAAVVVATGVLSPRPRRGRGTREEAGRLPRTPPDERASPARDARRRCRSRRWCPPPEAEVGVGCPMASRPATTTRVVACALLTGRARPSRLVRVVRRGRVPGRHAMLELGRVRGARGRQREREQVLGGR